MSASKNVVRFDTDADPEKVTLTHPQDNSQSLDTVHTAESVSTSSLSTNTDPESQSCNSKKFTFPKLMFSEEDGSVLEVEKAFPDYGGYVPVPFEDVEELLDTILCFFFIFRIYGGMWLGPGTQFSDYRHPNEKGIFLFHICNVSVYFYELPSTVTC